MRVAVNTPSHSAPTCSTTPAPAACARNAGARALGRREVLGVVWDASARAPGTSPTSCAPWHGVLEGLAPLDAPGAAWWRLPRATTSAAWARWPWPPCPRNCATCSPQQLARRLRRPSTQGDTFNATYLIALTQNRKAPEPKLMQKNGPFLLFGSTGSGKTEVYLRCVQDLLARSPPPRRW